MNYHDCPKDLRTPNTTRWRRYTDAVRCSFANLQMYVAHQNSLWTEEENAWLKSEFSDPEIRGLVKTGLGEQNDYGDAANRICSDYVLKFPEPRRGETDEEFLERKKRTAGTHLRAQADSGRDEGRKD